MDEDDASKDAPVSKPVTVLIDGGRNAMITHLARLAMARGGTEVRPLDVEPEPILAPQDFYVAKRSRAENGAPLPGKQRRGGHRKRRGK